jgi:hypothetical protein
MTDVTLTATADTHLVSETPTNNKDADAYVDVGHLTTPTSRRALILFDVSGIPSGATVSAATLRLQVSLNATTTSHNELVYRLRRAWSETQATWNVYTTGNSWTTAGAADTTNDREGTAICTKAITSRSGSRARSRTTASSSSRTTRPTRR